MAKIITVTLNPTLDRTLFTHYISQGYHNRVTGPTRLDPAGRGVNIARALGQLGVIAEAIVLLGDDAIGLAYEALIKQERFPVHLFKRAGVTRSNTIILDSGHKTETHIIEESSGGGQADLTGIAQALQKMTESGDWVVFGGIRLTGLRSDAYAHLTTVVHQKGGKAVIIAAGDSLGDTLLAKPDIVAITQGEMENYCNYPVRSDGDITYSGRKLIESGAGMVLVTHQEAHHTLLITADEAWSATEALSNAVQGTTSGVQDAILAGFLYAYLYRQNPAPEALAYGVAAGNYTRTQVGNEFGTDENIATFRQTVSLVNLAAASA